MISPTTPSLLESASQSLRNGLAGMDRAAAEIVSATTTNQSTIDDAGQPDSVTHAVVPPAGSAPADPLLNGIMDSITAQMQVTAGVALIHAYQRTTDELFDMLRPRRSDRA